MRRLAIGMLTAVGGLALLALTGGAGAGATAPPGADTPPSAAAVDVAQVDVLQVSGLIDDIVVNAIEDAIAQSADNGSQALILQMNTRGAVVGDDEMEAAARNHRRRPAAGRHLGGAIGRPSVRHSGTAARGRRRHRHGAGQPDRPHR